jgi:hypothetical protein
MAEENPSSRFEITPEMIEQRCLDELFDATVTAETAERLGMPDLVEG